MLLKQLPKRINAIANVHVLPRRLKADGEAKKARRRFRMIANNGDMMDIDGYTNPVVVDLASIDLAKSQQIPALFLHDRSGADSIVGQIDKVFLAEGYLQAEGFFVKGPVTSKVLEKAEDGYVWQCSIGGEPAYVDMVKQGQTIAVNGKTFEGPLCVARGLKLVEISFVVIGADTQTAAVLASKKAAKNRKIEGYAMSFEDWLVSLGFGTESQSSLTEIQITNLKQKYLMEYPEVEDPPVPAMDEEEVVDEEEVTSEGEGEEEELEEELPTNAGAKKHSEYVEAELARIRGITRIAAAYKVSQITAKNGKTVDFVDHAISQKWSIDRVKAEVLDMRRGKMIHTPNVVVKAASSKKEQLAALEASLIERNNGSIDDKRIAASRGSHALFGAGHWMTRDVNDQVRDKIMNASRSYGGLSAVDICREILRIEGSSVANSFDRKEVIKAAFSGGSLANVFTTNVNAILLASYMESVDTTMDWTMAVEVANFQSQERPRVRLGDGLALLPPGASADHADYADEVESYRIYRFAKQFVVDEQDIINDRLNALGDTPRRLGLAAARLRPDIVYAILMSNPTLTATGRALFNSTDGNLATSSSLSATTLAAAIAAMMKMQENSVNINLKMTHAIVPPSLMHTLRNLVGSTDIALTGSTSVEKGNINPIYADNVKPLSDARLENGVTDPISGTTTAGSATTWYGVSTDSPGIEVAYLSGTGRAPQVRPFMLDRGQWGMGWDVKHDIGAKALDFRPLRKHTA